MSSSGGDAKHDTYIQDLQRLKVVDHGGEGGQLVGVQVEACEVHLLPPAVVITVVHPHVHGHLLGLLGVYFIDVIHLFRDCRKTVCAQLNTTQ